ncbi:RNA-directed DNA polymerase from mobile element jockey, partial [Paramuricea clavata]
DVVLTPDDVANVLRTFDNDKAHGPDGIPAHLLTETASQIAPSLCQLFNKSLRIGVVPSDWKLANVVPAHKKGDQEFVEHYRPISLLPLVSKVLERCVFNTIKDHIFCRINPCQHGFLPGKNCVTQLIEVFDKIGKQLDRGKQIDVIYFDMSKAFDKVSHKRLLLRLREFGFGGNILNWFRSYLQDRRQQTTILGATSLPSQVISGVSQGSILGPVLFLLCENDLPSSVKNSSIATYADDTKIFKEIHNIGDAASLQEDLSNFESSSSDMGLHLNTSKCKALRVTGKHRKIKYPYTLQDSMLENVENERDLCVWISNNLTWRKQVLEQCSKANKMLGFIKRSTRTIKNCLTNVPFLISVSDWYLYIKASSPRQPNDTARLISPSTTQAKSCLLFFYHMYGNHIGKLRVYVKSGGKMDSLWSLSGDQGNGWFHERVAVNNQTASYQFVIEGVRGNGWRGDIAIDDISVMDSCLPRDKFSCDFEDPNSCEWTQDKSDDFDWTRNQASTPTQRSGPTTDHTKGLESVIFCLPRYHALPSLQ